MSQRTAVLHVAAVTIAYLAITAVYTHPLVWRLDDGIANDRYDPVLNAAILWWNATTVPFSETWWTPPHYYPSEGIAAFTENLVGLSIITTPLLWGTRDPVLTYNLAVFLTWPLSALALYLLARRLGAGPASSFIGGLAFGFAPYRMTQMAHLQVLACFWLPLALAGLHGYLQTQRTRWLVLFGAVWVLQSLTNGYFMLFGAVLIAGWLTYFCSTRETWKAAGPILIAWALASVPLVPVMLAYQRVHADHGLTRGVEAILHYAAEPSAWFRVSQLAAVWGSRLADGGSEWNLFPGATVVLLVVAAGGWTLATAAAPPGPVTPARRLLRSAALVTAGLCSLALVVTLMIGPWRVSPLGLTIRMSSIGRAAICSFLALAAFRLLGGWRVHPGERRPFGFYLFATLAVVVFCMGPQVRSGGRLLLDPAPYAWLMTLPGFEGLRVPTRFWMLGAMCLATAAALAFDRLAPARRQWRLLLAAVVSAAVLADGWMREMPVADAPGHWPRVEPRAAGRALLELPLGPEWDAAATFRAVRHRRRVVNGVSGYDPPHYGLLQHGLNAHDPSVLLALASLGPLDVVVDGSADPDGAWERYVSAIPGVERASSDGIRTAYRMPDLAAGPTAPLRAVPIQTVGASTGDPDVRFTIDGDIATAWTSAPQSSGTWLVIDLGTLQSVGGLTHALGASLNDFPRELAVELSVNGVDWEAVWQGVGLGQALLAIMRTPRDASVELRFEPRLARFVRLRLTQDAKAAWTVAELRVLAGDRADAGQGGRREP